MEEILKMARALGEAVARHPHYLALRRAEEAAQADPQATALIDHFVKQQERLIQLTRQRKPLEPEDKRQLADLERQVMANPALKALQAAQVNFKHLMDTINRAIEQSLAPPAEQDQSS